MGLEKHLGYSSGPSEITVNLERRMGVEKIILGGLGEKGVNIGSSLFAILEASVEIDQPRPAPAGVGSLTCDRILIVLAPALDRALCGGEYLGIIVCDHRTGIEAEKMGHVAVTRFDLLIVLNPFLDGVVALAYLQRREFCHGLLDLGPESRIVSKDLGSIDHGLEELVGNLDVHCS